MTEQEFDEELVFLNSGQTQQSDPPQQEWQEELYPSEEDRDWEDGKKKRAAARKARRDEQQKKREMKMLLGAGVIVGLVLLVLFIGFVKGCAQRKREEEQAQALLESLEKESAEKEEAKEAAASQVVAQPPQPVKEVKKYTFTQAETLQAIPEDVVSQYAVLVDCVTNQIVAGKEIHTRMIPASMIKILTVLTAYDYVEDMDDTTEITIDITDYTFTNDCSIVGYTVGDKPTIEELFYGTILPSGADAAIALAKYCAGSTEEFANRMNEKAKELGLKDTHVVNCVGMHEEEQYSTVYDTAVMLRSAMDNPFLRKVLSLHSYTTAPTIEEPEGLLISNWYLRRIEDLDCHGTVIGGKTGYVEASGSCCACFAEDKNGKSYILVTGGSTTSRRCINDHVAIFQKFFPQ